MTRYGSIHVRGDMRKIKEAMTGGGLMKTILSAFMTAVVALSICAVHSAAEEQQKAVARVNGMPITELQLEQAIDVYVPPGTFHSGAGQKRDQYRKPALDLLIERELLYQEAKAKGVKVTSKDVDRALAEVKKKYKDKNAFDAALRYSGLSLDEYKAILKRNEYIEKLQRLEVDDQAKYSDEALEAYYDANKDKFLKPEAFKIRHILLKVPPTAGDAEKREIREKADSLLKKINEGEDFGDLAYKNSQDDYRVKGGDLGWVHKGRLDPAVEEAAFKLNVGESTIVETMYGYHMVKLEGKKPAEQLSFSDVKDSLRKDLESKKQKELKEALMARLKEKAKIQIY
jgi:peptidyl-prolyl cis-trans isomerase C